MTDLLSRIKSWLAVAGWAAVGVLWLRLGSERRARLRERREATQTAWKTRDEQVAEAAAASDKELADDEKKLSDALRAYDPNFKQ